MMFIEVEAPHGTAYVRADRIESVCPIAQDDNPMIDNDTPRTMIAMISSPEDAWFVIDDTATVMEKINHEIKHLSLQTVEGVNKRTIQRIEGQMITLLNRTQGMGEP